MSSQINERTESRQRIGLRRAWRESHGNLLLLFAAIIVLLGLLAIWANPSRDEVSMEYLEGQDSEAPLPEDAFLIRISTDAVDSEGPVRFAIYDSEEAFGDASKALIKDAMIPVDGFAVWELRLQSLPEAFGIAAYHDLDDNGALNRGLLNAPIEPYGFSNNARSLVGPPSYQQTLVNRPAESTMVEIRVR